MTSVNSYSLLDRSDMQYPQIKLLQPGSKEVSEGTCQAGNFFDTISGEVFKKVSLIVLGVRKEFRVWQGDDGLSKYPEYVSNDMKTLVHLDPETGEKIGEESLEKSEIWNNRKGNKKAKTQYFFLAAKPGSNIPVFFRVGGLGGKRARRFLNQAQNTGKQLFEFITELSVATEQSEFGPKYVFNLQQTNQPLPPDWKIEQGAERCRKFIQDSQPALISSANRQ